MLAVTATQPDISCDDPADEKAKNQRHPGSVVDGNPGATRNGNCDHCPTGVADLDRPCPFRPRTEAGARQRLNRHGTKARTVKIDQSGGPTVSSGLVEIEIQRSCLRCLENSLYQHGGLK